MSKPTEKMGISTILRVAKCGDGFHFRIPMRIAKAWDLEPRDEIHVDLKILRRYAEKE